MSDDHNQRPIPAAILLLEFMADIRAAIATDLASPVVRAAFIIAAPTLAAVLGIEGEKR